jgi:hypothetical protein
MKTGTGTASNSGFCGAAPQAMAEPVPVFIRPLGEWIRIFFGFLFWVRSVFFCFRALEMESNVARAVAFVTGSF